MKSNFRFPLFILFFFGVLHVMSAVEPSSGEKVRKVSLSVELWREDRQIAQYKRIQTAIDEAQPGDIIRLQEGVYHEPVTMRNKIATADRSFILEGPLKGEAVLDGADPQLQESGSGRWQRRSDGIWEATVPWSGRESRALLTWASRQDESLIATHHTEAIFREHPRGDAFYRVGSRVCLTLLGEDDPNKLPLNIGVSESVIDIQSSSGWIIRRISIRHAGFAGILIGSDVRDVKIEEVTIQTAFRGISTEDYSANNAPRKIRIDRCRILNFWNFDWEWSQGYSDSVSARSDEEAPMRGGGIHLMANDSEISHCEVAGQWDGLRCQGNGNEVHHNLIHHTNDDMVELESNNSSNLRFHDNLGFHLFAGISLVSDTPGPIYIYRNRIQCAEKIRFQGASYRYGYPLKFGRDWGPGARNIFIYQNTFDSLGRSLFVKTDNPLMTKWSCIEWINNIFSRGESGPVGIEGMGAPEAKIVWAGNVFASANELARLKILSPGFAHAGIVGNPDLIGQTETPPVLALNEASSARGAGTMRPQQMNWPDSVPASPSRDAGAIPFGTSPIQVGPGGSLYWPWPKGPIHP